MPFSPLSRAADPQTAPTMMPCAGRRNRPSKLYAGRAYSLCFPSPPVPYLFMPPLPTHPTILLSFLLGAPSATAIGLRAALNHIITSVPFFCPFLLPFSVHPSVLLLLFRSVHLPFLLFFVSIGRLFCVGAPTPYNSDHTLADHHESHDELGFACFFSHSLQTRVATYLLRVSLCLCPTLM